MNHKQILATNNVGTQHKNEFHIFNQAEFTDATQKYKMAILLKRKIKQKGREWENKTII